MPVPFPEAGRIDVSRAMARELRMGVERLPLYDNKEFYSPGLQMLVRDRIRQVCPDGFDQLISLVRERIAQWPYCVLLRGLLFDEGNRLFVAINRAFGELVAPPYQKPRAQLVHYIQPSTDILSSRGGRESERLHTDTADWETPVDLISMVCMRADHLGGGRSRVLDIETVREEVRGRLGSQALELLDTEPVPWRLAPYCGGGVKWRTVLTESRICWRRYTIDLALGSDGIALSDTMSATLNAFEGVIASATRTVDFLMREGDLLFVDNKRTVHARTSIAEGAKSQRLMIRSWILAS
jgi:hypothetical protein